MSALVEYTIEIYKSDKRTKEGRRLVAIEDFAPSSKWFIGAVADAKRKLGFSVEVFETYVTRKDNVSGRVFRERYDTPYFCSPSSETFWSM